MTDTNWQTIDTAPKDGSKILIWNKKWGMALVSIWDEHPDAKDQNGKVQDSRGRWVTKKGWKHRYIPWPQCPGEEGHFLGWPEDIKNKKMPTHWCYPPTTKEKNDD